jgi:SAM-dependent methyltransferase
MFRNVRRWLAPLALGAQAAVCAAPAAAQTAPDLDVPYVTTPDQVVDAMLSLAGVTARDFVLDLGSGDGRIVITAATKFGARGMGVEIDPALVQLSIENAEKAGVAARARFVEQDLFATDLAQASVITMYLLPDVNLKLRPELLKLRPGTRIVSHDWDMGDWQPDGKLVLDVPEKKLGLKKESTLLLWTVPAVVEGTWTSGKLLRLELRQRYQMLEGAVTYRGQTYTDASGRVDGTRVHLCFTHHDTGRCRLGALGQLLGSGLRLLVDGAGRQQITVIARKQSARQGK